jgi:DNA-binding GntR family transcriptional regulator
LISSEVAPPTAQQAVLEALREAIRSGVLAPGAVIRQEALAEQFGLSRVPVREALKFLEGEGTVTYLPHRGFTVAEPSNAELLELLALRQILSLEAVRTALNRLGEAERAEITEALRVVEDSQGKPNAHRSVRSLHFAIMAPSRLKKTLKLLVQIWDSIDASGYSEKFVVWNDQNAVRECNDLVQAVLNLDSSSAGEVLSRIKARQASILSESPGG